MENFGVSQSAGTCGEAWRLGAGLASARMGVNRVALPLVTGTEAELMAKMYFFFFCIG